MIFYGGWHLIFEILCVGVLGAHRKSTNYNPVIDSLHPVKDELNLLCSVSIHELDCLYLRTTDEHLAIYRLGLLQFIHS